MKSVKEIYSDYRIAPNLALHQLRVAAVAKLLADSFNEKVDAESIIPACLFHDMGNIIKSDFSRFPEFLKPQGIEYWQKVKDDYIKKYGPNESVAAEKIAKEIGLSQGAINCLEHIGFVHATENEKGDSYENMICNYADMRVGPHGVLSMEERITEGRKRYEGKKHSISSADFDLHTKSLYSMEKKIFAKTTIRPEEITDSRIEPVIEKLRELSF